MILKYSAVYFDAGSESSDSDPEYWRLKTSVLGGEGVGWEVGENVAESE